MEKQMQRQLDKKFGWVCHNRGELIFGPRQFDNWVKRVTNEEPVVHVELGGRFNGIGVETEG